jgi:hypothetical protein
MDDFRLVAVIVGPLTLFVDYPFTRPVKSRCERIAPMPTADNLDVEMVNRHWFL